MLRRRSTLVWALHLLCGLGALGAPQAFAIQKFSAEQGFQDLFITAGYSTAFGAALGAAVIGLKGEDPLGKLHYIAIGASTGFIAGSLLGTYIIFSPAIEFSNPKRAKSDPIEPMSPLSSTERGGAEGGPLAPWTKSQPLGLVITPTFSPTTGEVSYVRADWLIAQF